MAKIYWFLGDEHFQPEELLKQAELLEDCGFDGVMVSEHLQPWVADQGAAGFTFATLGAMAAKTSRINLMTGVTTPLFRFHPAVVAQAAATIDRISGGRFELGIGTGEFINEGALSKAFPSYQERSERIMEAINIISSLFQGTKLNYDGQYYQVNNLKLYSPPLNYIPILMAVGGPKSAQIAKSSCDGIITSVKNIQGTKDFLQLQDSPQNFRLVASSWSIYAEDNLQAWEALGPWRGLRAPSRALSSDPQVLQDEADQLDPEEILSKYQIVHSMSDYYDVYSPLITELKAETVVIQTTSLNQNNTIKLFGEKVLPRLKIL
jgi:G6PDH family F420-dependent oxidoreductase